MPLVPVQNSVSHRVRAIHSFLPAVLLLALSTLGAASGASAAGSAEADHPDPRLLDIHSASALIVDDRGRTIYAKNASRVQPIASITKLMTAMIVLDAHVPMDETIRILDIDKDRLRNSRSRLLIGEARLQRREMLLVALMSSDNRAASALARTTFSGGTPVFIAAMNRKARALGMHDTTFADPTGLDARNQSSPQDLVRMIHAAAKYPFIRQATTTGAHTAHPFATRPPLEYRNTNPLVRNPSWQVELSKTGFINESGHCLVMQARIDQRRLYMVFLNAQGRLTPMGDSNRLRKWLTGTRTAGR